ncbi:uncharacterized protein LOC144879422 isoform X2 [Branchiostoma floridae x Branchiostoma japonicum]
MHLSLEVLASASIKRKKPWPQLTWVGKEKESLLLMDHRRLSLLYLPSGKTKRKITKVNKMLPNTLSMNTSSNGSYLLGLLATGEVFVWHKDTDLLRTTAPLPNMEDNSSQTNSRRHLVYISNEGGKILVVRKDGKVHVWQKDGHSSPSVSPQKATGKITELSGRWYEVGGGKTQLPGVDCKEVAVDAVFFQDQVQGNCCTCSFVFNNGRTFTVSTAFLHWQERADAFAYGPVPFSVTWKVAQHPLAAAVPDSALIRSRGAYLASYTHDGQVLAVACNQWQPNDTKVMFVSVFTSTAVEANMKSCGAKTCDLPPKILRTYWICGMKWTCDDLLLVCITKRGSVVILTRLGEPLMLTTHGCSVEMGPCLYLPLHPLIMYSPGQENIHPSKLASQSPPPSTSEIDPLKQRFSVATHPRLPIILCSDGYMVTVMQLPSDLTTPNILKMLCMEANQVLSSLGVQPKLGSTLTRVFNQGGVGDKGKGGKQWRKAAAGLKMSNTNRTQETNSFTGTKSSTIKKGGLPRYTFEEPTDSGDLSQSESDVSTIGANVSKAGLASGDEGKIFFGDHDFVNDTVVRPEKAKTSLELAESVSTTLLCAWGLSLSYSGQWTWELEVITRHIADCLVKLVSCLLQAEEVREEKKKRRKTRKEHSGLLKALVLFRHALNMTNWDSVHQHCLPCAVRLVDGVTGQLLGRVRGHDQQVRGQLEALAGCQHLLRFAEERLNRAYMWTSGIGGNLAHGSGSERLPDPGCKIQGKPGQKLAKSWKLLYNLTVKQYLSLKTGGSAKLSERRATLSLLGQIQHQLQTLGCGIERTKKARPDPTNQILLSGDTTQALHQWEEKLKSLQDKPETPHSVAMETMTLLSILYTHLLQYNLGAALLLVQSLIDSWDGESSTNQGPSKLSSYLAVEGGGDFEGHEGLGVLRKAARPVVRTLARFMAAYFSNRQLIVYPPHAARPLPPVHLKVQTGPRATPLHHTEVASAVRRQSLSDVWTANFTMELLLLCGQAPEAVWLANQLGDWKGAFMLAVSYLDYLKTIPVTAKLNQSLQLPESLHPLALLQGRLMSFLSSSSGGAESSHTAMDGALHTLKRTASTGSLHFDEDSSTDQVCRSLQDLLTAATVAGAEAVPWLLERVVRQMQAVCSRLSAEVPAGLYLPAPPLYLPQPASTSEDYVDPDVRHEKDLRREMAHLTQLALVLLQAAGCQLPCARWYLQQLIKARQMYNKKIKKLSSNTTVELPEGLATLLAASQDFRTLHSTSQPQGSQTAPSQSQDTLPEPTLRVVTSFRQLCGLLWMLEARERLSLCGRKLQTLREKAFKQPGNSDSQEQELCEAALDWALNMLPFADYLDAEGDLQDIVLSLVGELPMTSTTGDILAEHFYDPELLSPTVEEKWNHLQTKMRKTRISVEQTTKEEGVVLKESKKQGSKNDGKTIMLSVYTHRKSSKQKKEIEKKARVFGSYETQVFSKTSSNKKVCVGSWPFETEDAYLFFLETFFSVSFEKAKQEDKGEKIPLLAPYKLEVREREVNSMAHKAMLTFQHKSLVVKAAMSFLGEAGHKDIPSKSLGKKSLSQSLSSVVGGKPERKRLFKSRSVTDVNESETVQMGDVSTEGDDGKLSKRSLSQRRAASLSDLGQQRSPTRSWVSMTDLRPKGVNLGGKFDELTPLVEWLHRWSCKKNMMSPSVKDGTFPGGGGAVDSKAVIRVRVPPSLVLTSFWLMENLYFKKQLSSSTLRVPPQEYVVYPAFGGSDSGAQHATSHESGNREEMPRRDVDQDRRQDAKVSNEESKGRKGRKQSAVKKQGSHETSSEGMSTEEARKLTRRPRPNKQQQVHPHADKRGKSPVRVHASIPRHVLESPTEISSSSWTPVLSSDSPTEEKAVPPPASMTSVTSMSPPRVEPKKKLSFASLPSTISPEETIKSEDSSTFNISSLADDESQATPTGQPITIPTPGSHLTRERPVASSTPHSAYGGRRSDEQEQAPSEKSPRRAAQDDTVIRKKGQAGSKDKGRVTSGAPVPSGSSSLPGFSVPKKGSKVPGSPSSSVEDAVNNVKEMRQLVRSELRSILEVQHQNIVSLLNTSGTVNVVVGRSEHNPGPAQVNTADRHTQVSQELQVAQLEQIAAQVSPTAPASAQVQNGPQSAAHHPGNPTSQSQMEPYIHNTQGVSHPAIPLLRYPGFPDYSSNPVISATLRNTHEPRTNPHHQNPHHQNLPTFGNPYPDDSMTRPDNPGHNPGYAVPGSSLHPPGMPLLRLPPEMPFQRPVTVPFEAWGQSSRPSETHNHNVQVPQDGGNTGWPSHLNLEQYDTELVNSVGTKGAKKDSGPLLLPNNAKSKKAHDKPITNPAPQQSGTAEGMGFPGAPGAFTPAMPLLHLDNSYAPSQMMRGMYRMPQPQKSQNNYPHFPTFPQPPVMSAPPLPPPDVEDVALRLPLLHLRDDPQAPSYQYSFAPGMPRLVRPEEIIAYEQKKHQTEILQTHRRQTKREEGAAGRGQESLPLLQADIEPWDPKGDRENLNRQRRRMKKDSGVSQDAERIQRRGRGREKEIRASVTEDEDEPTHDEVPLPGVIVVQPSPGPVRTTQHKATAQDRLDTDTDMPRDQGYVIPPGTFDEYLEYQTVVPTPAQIHYDAVINKKAKPVMKTADTQTDKPSKDEEVDTQTVQTEPERERAKPQTTAEKETNTVIVVSRDVYSAEQVVSQYAASGMDISHGGPGLPPDIFFNLRFGREAAQAADSSAGPTPSQRQDQEVQTPAFLNVVDIDNSLMKDLKPTKQPRQRQRTLPDTEETVEGQERSPASGLPDDATPADLHYRLAGLTNSVKPAEVDDEGNIIEPPSGDSLTVDLLSSITGESPVNLAKIRRDTAGVRAKSRERLADKLTEMGRQLDAIDQMANNMEDDFKNTRLLVNTIDNLGEAIHPEEEEAVARRPSGRGQQYDSRRHDTSIPSTIEEEESFEPPIKEKPLPSPILEEEEEDVDKNEEDRSDQVPITAPKQADRNLERLLDMTGLSGVSDIIAEVFADGGLKEEDLRLSLTGADLTRDSTLPSAPFASTQLSVDTLQDVFSPRAQDTSRQEEEKRAKKRKEVQKWMLEKRTERRSEYLKQLEELRSTEHQPYKPAQDSPKQGATWKQIHQAEKEMEDRRKALLRENMSERVKQAYDLMGDIVIDTPEYPASSLPPPSVKKKKPAKPSSSARGSSPLRRGLPKSSTPIPRSQTWRMQDAGFDVDEYDIDDAYIEELLQDSGEVQEDMLKTYKVRDVSKIGEQPAAQGGRRPKPFTQLVRQQRPEAARKQTTGKPKTYAEKLGDANASKIPRPTFNKLKDKQRLYGTTRLPGTAKSREKTSPRLVKTYAQRLQELRRTPGSTYSRPILTTKGDGVAAGGATSRNRMQEVTRRGLHSEPKPRKYSSTYAQRLQSQQPDTGRRGGRVSPRQPVGKRFEGARHKPKTYSQQLQDISASAPKGRPRLAYTGTSSRGFKSPSMRTQTLRHAPYPDVYESVLEDISEASTASLLRSTSDDVRRILEEEDIFGDGGARPRQRDYPDYDASSLYDVGDDLLGDDYINSVDPDQLSQASQSTGSILSNINWDEVEQLIATVE